MDWRGFWTERLTNHGPGAPLGGIEGSGWKVAYDETASEMDLGYFFIQWIESSGAPDFKLEYTILRTAKGFRVMGKIAQDLDTFRMPVDLKIETEGNPEEKRVEVMGTASTRRSISRGAVRPSRKDSLASRQRFARPSPAW